LDEEGAPDELDFRSCCGARSLSRVSQGVRVGYVLQGVVASGSALRPCEAFVDGVVVDLGQGLGGVPMPQALFDEVRRARLTRSTKPPARGSRRLVSPDRLDRD